ncbi:YqaA family protein [Frigidibacter sp. MR17.24]|uniref:YqaA family protein n=1 Tax=Frigidibacter sp. MR17.24 TaxID=3127345 RepID=UPI003012F0A0
MLALLGLFAAAAIAATILPAQSEAVLVALLLAGEHPAWLLLAVATGGNVLGAVANWALGRGLAAGAARHGPERRARLARAERWYRRWGAWSLLGSWLPVVGDPLTVVAGVLREPLGRFLVLVTIAKGGRYLVLAAAVRATV